MKSFPIRCTMKEGWFEAGKTGVILAEPVFVNQYWTPVLWDDEEDPDFCKTAALDFVKPHQRLKGQ